MPPNESNLIYRILTRPLFDRKWKNSTTQSSCKEKNQDISTRGKGQLRNRERGGNENFPRAIFQGADKIARFTLAKRSGRSLPKNTVDLSPNYGFHSKSPARNLRRVKARKFVPRRLQSKLPPSLPKFRKTTPTERRKGWMGGWRPSGSRCLWFPSPPATLQASPKLPQGVGEWSSGLRSRLKFGSLSPREGRSLWRPPGAVGALWLAAYRSRGGPKPGGGSPTCPPFLLLRMPAKAEGAF